MLLRISLIVAILAGGAALYFSHFQVQEKITTITTERDDFKKRSEEQTAAANKAKAEAKKAKDDFDAASKNLEEKTAALEETTKQLTEQRKRANQASEALVSVTKERNDAQQELNAFKLLGLTFEQIRSLRDDLKRTTDERDAYIGENKILLRNNTQLQTELAHYTGPREPDVPLPPGLRGKIVAVDPKYDFVVLDVGATQGALEHGKMLVNRNGKLIGTVRITRVEPNRSIANIVAEARQSDLMEGDLVFVR